jgi:hypothetical protein
MRNVILALHPCFTVQKWCAVNNKENLKFDYGLAVGNTGLYTAIQSRKKFIIAKCFV